MLKTFGLANPAIAAKSMLGGATINTLLRGGQNVYEKKPVFQGTGQAFQQGSIRGLANAGTTRLTQGLVSGLANKIPLLKPLTEKSLKAGLPTAQDTLKTGIRKWANVAGKKLIRSAVIETLVETPIWATLTQGDKETFLEAIQREAVENLVMNVGFAGVDILGDANKLSPMVKKSIGDAIQNYKNLPIEQKMAGKIDLGAKVGKPDLISEARKYKSAEEFVKGQINPRFENKGKVIGKKSMPSFLGIKRVLFLRTMILFLINFLLVIQIQKEKHPEQ